MFKKVLYISLIILLLSIFNIEAIAIEYTVRTVYFIPTDSQDKSNWLDLDSMMKTNQEVYKDEMSRHGFDDKEFRLELDNDGNVIVHKIHGKHNKAHYFANTLNKVKEELRLKFNDRKNIYAIVIAGIDALEAGRASGIANAGPGG